MPRYAYKAVDQDGRMILGRIDARNTADLEMRLRRMTLDFVAGKMLTGKRITGSNRLQRRQLIHLCFHLEQLTRAGVPILESLSDLRDSQDQASIRGLLANLLDAIEGGQTLSQAMESQGGVFDAVFVNLIRSGETSGRLPDVLQKLGDALKWEDELAAQTKKLLLYPAFVGTIVLAASLFLMLHLVPQMKPFVGNMGLPIPQHTQWLFLASDLLLAYGHAMALTPIFLFAGTRLWLRSSPTARLQYDALKLRLPLFGSILQKIVLCRFVGTFSLLYVSGIPILDALRSTQGVVGNRVIRRALALAEQQISEGKNMSAAFSEGGLFPPLVIRMLHIGESTGALGEALNNVSYFYNREIGESIDSVQKMIEPMLTVLLGLLLGWVALSVLGPIYEVIGSVRS